MGTKPPPSRRRASGACKASCAAASVAAEADPGGSLFRQLMSPLAKEGGRFVSASVWPLETVDPRPTIVVGEPPVMLDASPATTRAFLAAAAEGATLSIRDLLGSDRRRLGYAYAVPGARSVAYAEAALPKNRRATIASDSAFAELDYALYLGRQATSTQLLASSSGHGLRGERTATDIVPFGDTDLLLVVSPRSELGGDVLAALPWILATLGLLLTFVAAFLTERLIRRRERAEELSDRLEEVAEENAALYGSQREISQQLQRSLMPRSLPRFEGLEASARYEAGVEGTEVGGDWYDVVPLSDHRLVFSVGDVCGRGLAAAALMASLRYSIRAYALEQDDPATILDKLTAMMGTTGVENFATVVCGTLDTADGTLTVAARRASRPPRRRPRRGALPRRAARPTGRGGRRLDIPVGDAFAPRPGNAARVHRRTRRTAPGAPRRRVRAPPPARRGREPADHRPRGARRRHARGTRVRRRHRRPRPALDARSGRSPADPRPRHGFEPRPGTGKTALTRGSSLSSSLGLVPGSTRAQRFVPTPAIKERLRRWEWASG